MDSRVSERDEDRFEYIEDAPKIVGLLKDIFTEAFMQKHTRFDSFEGFQYSSAVFVNWSGECLVYDRRNLDNFVRESTHFSTWDEMVRTATDCRYK